jgi:hypothetical protein
MRIQTLVLREIIIFVDFRTRWLVVCIFQVRASQLLLSAHERQSRGEMRGLEAERQAALTTRLLRSSTAIM